MNKKKIIVAVMAITLLAIGIIGKQNAIPTQAAIEQSIVFSEEDKNLVVKPGEINHVSLPIKAVGGIIFQPVASITGSDTSPFEFTKPKVLSSYKTPTDIVTTGSTTYVEFDVTVDETAKIGNYPVTLTMDGMDLDNAPGSLVLNFNLQILEEKAPAQLTITNVFCKNPLIGVNAEVNFLLKNEGEITARNVYINVSYGDTGIAKNYSTKSIKVGELAPGEQQTVTLPISILTSATAGKKSLTVNCVYKDINGVESTDSSNIDIDVIKNEKAPDLYIESVQYNGNLAPGGEFTLVATLRNLGGSEANEITVSLDDANIGTAGLIKKYYTDILVPDIKTDAKRNVEIPLAVSKGAEGGIKNLQVNITYKDGVGITYTKTETVYPDVIGATASNIIISGVQQTPAQPVAGEKMEVSFYFENKSAADITDLKISLPNLADNSFIPVKSEPYQYIEKLKSGQKMKITIPLIVSDTIKEGANNLQINYSYAGSGNIPENIPILGVINDLGSSSKPKLIVSNYTADSEELRAGSTFNFTFDLYNTNASVAAKNITVTVTQADNVFTVTQGSNSFFINKIDAGETVTNTLELKVKSDASTKAYELIITVEYEYDDIKPNPTTGEIGETNPIKLSLQAVENSRPVIDYVNVYSYDGNNVMVSNPAMLSFEFYNMGKSPLNNVIATVEGDFTPSAGSMYFIGNVAEGTPAYAEFEVIPNIEGMAKGTVKITFEDSNGDEVSFIKEFETMVMGAQVFEPGMGEGGVDVFNPTIPVAKKKIVPVWLFIIIQVIIFVLFIPVTRKIIISVYKSKLRKKEEEKY